MFIAIYISISVISWLFFYTCLITGIKPEFKDEQIIFLCLSCLIALIWPVTLTGMFVMTIGKKLAKMTDKKED